MGMAIQTGWLTVSSPTSVCNPGVRVENFGHVWLGFGNELLELGNLANLLESHNHVLLVSIHAEPCGVISSVFETR